MTLGVYADMTKYHVSEERIRGIERELDDLKREMKKIKKRCKDIQNGGGIRMDATNKPYTVTDAIGKPYHQNRLV